MKRHVFSFLFVALASLATASAQVVPAGGMGQYLIARDLGGINCQNGSPTGFGTAELYFPYIAGIPTNFLFQPGAAVQDQTTAVLTAVFGKSALSQSTNYDMANVFIAPTEVNYYYHPKSSPKDWTDFDGFQAGQLIATYLVQTFMFTVAKGIAFGIGSGPFTYSTDFTLPDGTQANLQNFMPGGIAVHVMGELGNYVTANPPGGAPTVLNLTTSTGPFTLGSCAVMSPFSGTGINPASSRSSNGRRDAAGDGGDVQ